MANFDASTPQLKVVKKWFDAYSSLDTDKLHPLLSKHYTHQTFPETIHHGDTKDGHVQKYEGHLPWITKLEFHVHEVIEAPGKVVLHSTATCSAHGTTFSADSALILSLVEEDGELKILQLKQFTDPQAQSALESASAEAGGAPNS